jgi:hypothetical protein
MVGSGVNDKLTAAQVATLTGGGNADMLHTHTAQSITGMVGGSCMTAWNTTLCPAGYGAAYTGTATSMAIYDGSNYGGIGTPICANAMTHPQTNSSTFVRWVSPAPAASNVNYGHAWNQNLTMPCAVCCPAAAGAPSCIAQHSGLYPSASSSSIVIIPGTGVNNSTAYRSAPFTLASTFVNRKYRIDRMEVALTGSATAGAPSKYDLRLLDAELKVVGQWPLVHLGGRTDDQNEVQSCTNSCGYSNTASFTTYSAAIDIQYIGGTQLRMEVVDVTTGSTEVQVILVQSTCANNECAPWHKVSGCSL